MLLYCGSSTLLFADQPSAYIAIIIDDLGHNRDRGEQAINLPGKVTYAVLPNSLYASAISESAFSSNKEVIVHLPMENRNSFPMSADALTDKLNRAEFLLSVNSLIKKVPHARGINNHQGSYLTEQSEQMTWLMDDLKSRNFFFLDSRTSAKTVAYKIALNKDLLSGSRDVFLDNERTKFEIDLAFQKLIRIAKRRGTAIGIGHPHTQTLDYLKMAIPHLKQQGVELLSVSNIMALQNIKRVALQNSSVIQTSNVQIKDKQQESTSR
jgi:polysaccharide deacetylase 2 family uncharacterized protein YibQ